MISIIWATPDIDSTIAYIARVSNPNNQSNPKITGLLHYMMREGHVSPFEMANVCLEVNTTRDIGRQMLRHKSFAFQEFSQRYQDITTIGQFKHKDTRLQDTNNRQSSLETEDVELDAWWQNSQSRVIKQVAEVYNEALAKGIAKEQARAILPEGCTPSKLYMNGTIRSWIFYLKQRLHETTQKEHREVAQNILAKLREAAPITMEAFFPQ